jgi:hypothetical protein
VAIIYQAQIQPSKLELIASWLPNQPWFTDRSVEGLASLGAYRFDDPAGDVGIETLLVGTGNGIVQMPMTYRGEPLDGADEWLVGTMQHSMLGQRWVYDACADPVYASALAAVVFGAGSQAAEYVQGDGAPTLRNPSASVTGSGSADADVPPVGDVDDLQVSTDADTAVTTVTAPGWVLEVRRLLDRATDVQPVEAELLGTWADQAQPVRLASAHRR